MYFLDFFFVSNFKVQYFTDVKSNYPFFSEYNVKATQKIKPSHNFKHKICESTIGILNILNDWLKMKRKKIIQSIKENNIIYQFKICRYLY